MSPHTGVTARDAICGLINAAWLASPTTSSLLMLWDDREDDPPNDLGSNGLPITWARTTVRTFASGSETIGGPGQGKALTEGEVVVQIFTPPGDGRVLADAIAEVLKGAVRGVQSGDLWFAGVVPNEIGRDRVWTRTDFRAGFRYGEAI